MNIDRLIYTNKNLEIGNNSEFSFYTQYRYVQLESVKINNVKINFNKFLKFMDNLNIEHVNTIKCNIRCNFMAISLVKYNNIVKLRLRSIDKSIIHILNNLPNYINILVIEYPEIHNNNFFLDTAMTNLPPSLKKIVIKLPSSFFQNINDDIGYYQKRGYLNVLFGIKNPYKCIIEVDISKNRYRVLNDDDNDNAHLTLTNYNTFQNTNINQQIIIKKIIIKKVVPDPVNIGLQVEHVYLDSEERNRFAQDAHQYFIQPANDNNDNDNAENEDMEDMENIENIEVRVAKI